MQLFPTSPQIAGRKLLPAVGAVALGGALGAVARWAVGSIIATTDGTWPWPTLIVNLVGCALIGLAARHLERGSIRWDFTVTGVLGGFTTMSAFAVELNGLADADRPGLAMLYAGITLGGGIAAVSLAEIRAHR